MPLLPIPASILARFEAILEKRSISPIHRDNYKKWLRYFLDFYSKYPVPDTRADQVRLFIGRLQEKKQCPTHQKQAAHAVSLYFETLHKTDTRFSELQNEPALSEVPASQFVMENPSSFLNVKTTERVVSSMVRAKHQSWHQWEDDYPVVSDSPEWDNTIAKLAEEIKKRHYSRKSLKTYAHWSRQFQRFLKNKLPMSLTSQDVKKYLTYLAVKCNVSASPRTRHSMRFSFYCTVRKEKNSENWKMIKDVG